jgi:hypothetical protein
MQIDLGPIDTVIPYDNIPRQNDAAVDSVAASLKEFGWRQPIVVARRKCAGFVWGIGIDTYRCATDRPPRRPHETRRITAAKFAPNAIAAAAMAADAADKIADALLDRSAATDTKTVRQALRIIAAVLAGKLSDAGTGTEIFTGLDGSTDRVTVHVDPQGNRSSVTYP